MNKTALLSKGLRFCFNFLGAKSFLDLRETGPWDLIVWYVVIKQFGQGQTCKTTKESVLRLGRILTLSQIFATQKSSLLLSLLKVFLVLFSVV